MSAKYLYLLSEKKKKTTCHRAKIGEQKKGRERERKQVSAVLIILIKYIGNSKPKLLSWSRIWGEISSETLTETFFRNGFFLRYKAQTFELPHNNNDSLIGNEAQTTECLDQLTYATTSSVQKTPAHENQAFCIKSEDKVMDKMVSKMVFSKYLRFFF